MFGALVAGRAGAEGAEYRLAINVDVKDVRLSALLDAAKKAIASAGWPASR